MSAKHRETPAGILGQLNERSREIFRHIVDTYVETGEPVGSRTLSRRQGLVLSPATIRNVMADLEEAGLLYAPHTSAGRLPTDAGLRIFVDGLLEIGGDLSDDERASIERSAASRLDLQEQLTAVELQLQKRLRSQSPLPQLQHL